MYLQVLSWEYIHFLATNQITSESFWLLDLMDVKHPY